MSDGSASGSPPGGPAPRPVRARRRALLALDVAIVAVLVAHVTAFALARADQHRHDGDAEAIAAWAQARGVERIAWPAELRAAVPALLDAGATPVLVDTDPLVPQQLALNRAPVVVARHAAAAPATIERARFTRGPFTVQHVDLDAARAVPLRTGQSVGEEISRPYRYAPLRDSRRIPPEEPMTLRFSLAPGRYRFAVEAFDPERRARVVLTVGSGSGRLAREDVRLEEVVRRPHEVEFEVGTEGVQPVVVRASARGDGADASALVHAWRLERRADER